MESRLPNPVNNETKLFQLVRNWYQLYPDTLFPLDAWARKLDTYALTGKEELEIAVGANIHWVEHPGMIPVLASINLGVDQKQIAKLVKHHGCSVNDYDSHRYQRVAQTPETKQEHKKFIDLTRSKFQHEFIGAVLQVPENLPDVESYINSAWQGIEVQLISAEHAHLWPNTRMDDYFARLKVEKELPEERPQQTEAASFLYGVLELAGMTDDKILSLIHRSGFLNKSATNENGYKDDLFPTAFHEFDFHGHDNRKGANCAAVIRAINSVTDANERDLIASKLIKTLSEYSLLYEDQGGLEGHVSAAHFLPLLDNGVFGDVIDSTVLRLNLLEWPVEEKFVTSPLHEVDQSRLMCNLATEIMSIASEDFGRHHFKSLERFAKHWPAAHNATDVDVDGFVMHVMKGLECFLEAVRPVDSSEMDELTQRRVGRFLKLAATLGTPNYVKLNDLSSDSKRLMAVNGYKITEFTGMSNQHKGQVLDDALGL